MTESTGLICFAVIGMGVLLYALLAPRLLPKEVQSESLPAGRDRGGVVQKIAHWVVLGLGRLTFATLHAFEKLGVNMAREDVVIAEWTAWSEDIKADLADALADAQTLRDTDAAEDTAAANAQSEALANKLQAAFDKVTAPPVATDPGTTEPEVPPVVEEDTSVPEVGPVNPEDPSAARDGQ